MMNVLNIETLREFNQLYDYNLPEKVLGEILNCLNDYKYINQDDILDEFQYYAN